MDSFEKYVGQVFDKRYRIIKVIGIGGMAVVFEAIDMLMRRNVAVKMLKDDINNDQQAVKRFINESKAVAMLSHPNIVNIYDVSVKDNLKYIVMELVEGITLKNYILKKGVLSFHEIMNITEQILLALEHAHAKGIVHRDIKPQNIMMLKNGVIKVADFGIAKLPNAETVTMTDKAIGTVFYISPEQASGKQIDRRSDIYSLGVTMYEMATGKLPFVADSPVTVAIMQVKNQPKPPREINPNLPIGLEQIIIGAMEKSPDNRFQSATQMLRHVAQVKSNPRTVFKMPRHDTSTGSSTVNVGSQTPANVKKLTPPQRASRSMFPVIAGVATAFLIVCCISAVVVLMKLFEVTTTDNSIQITVPDFTDVIYSADLEARLESQYYIVEVEYVNDPAYDRNVIIGQDPLPNEKRKVIPDKQLCELTLKVCWGAETCELPDYAYQDARDVKIELRNELGLIPEEVSEPHDYIMEGYVIRTDPAPGTTMKAGDKVTLVVSSGQNVTYVKMPNFVGNDEATVMSRLNEAGLKLGNVTWEYSVTMPKGCVIKQSRVIDAQTPVGTKVDFVMSLGPEPVETTASPELEPEPEPDVTTEAPAETTRPGPGI
ncbi:MAG: Stk1 family PASTA domain-containing Ser/Thr kinase [Clostridia bacterium]|nr:Stk1 family PASTA domain-containing Ser/Thr kinase [Clostridia bacterium]